MRLFVAIEPTRQATASLRALPRPEVPGLRWTREQTWHVTLRFLGELPDAAQVIDRLQRADLGGPVRATLGPETTWLGRDVLVVPVTGLDELAGRVRRATEGVGQQPRGRGFDGHLTVARRRRRGGRVAGGAPLDCSFTVREVVLFSSTLGATGATHEALHRFPLTGP